MNAGGTTFLEGRTKLRDDVDAKQSNAFLVITKALNSLAYPSRYFGATATGEALQISKVSNGHNARMNRLANTRRKAAIQKIKIRFDIEKELGHGRICTCVQFLLQIKNVLLVTFGLRMDFRISRDGDLEVIAGVFANKAD